MKPSIFDDEYWVGRSFKRYIATDEEIRENQRINRLQRERVRAAHNDNSTSSNGQDTQDKDKN